jgi:hypothetical protein
MCFYKDSSSCVECLLSFICFAIPVLQISIFQMSHILFLHFSSVILSTERLSGQMGRTRLPSHLAPHAPHASCPCATCFARPIRTSCLTSRAARASAALRRTSHLPLELALPTAEVRGPWATSTSWHRALRRRRSSRQRASIRRQQVDEHTLQ